MNELHSYLGINGYNQVYAVETYNLDSFTGEQNYNFKCHAQIFVDQVSPDIVCVTRHNDVTQESVILASYTVFSGPDPLASGEGRGVTVTGCVENILIEAYLTHKYNRMVLIFFVAEKMNFA